MDADLLELLSSAEAQALLQRLVSGASTPDWADPRVLEPLDDLLGFIDRERWLPIATVPRNGRSVQVYLAEPMLGARIHTATYHPNVAMIGNVFAFDAPPATHWRPLPAPPSHPAVTTTS